ncbi:hypothetical protein [Streptomyces sp. NPDC037389]|uniref:hypothetical protein n=1 Tax=Streptomyces sp. NPDC037389 TaxID=3155369 RepID=UPI0033D8827C
MSEEEKKQPADTAWYTAEYLFEPIVGRFKREEYDHLKKKVNDLSLTVNGLSVGLDSAKLAFAGFSGGATLVKADFTGLKFDEKGMTFMGRQVTTWPWAKSEDERAQHRAERRVSTAENALTRAKAADRRARLNPGDADLQLRAKLARDELNRARKDAGKALGDVRKIARAAEQKKADTKKSLKDAVTSYRNSTRELKQMERAAAGLSRTLG